MGVMTFNQAAEQKRYRIVKEGEPEKIGYLFPDNVLFWEARGYKCILSQN